MIPNILTTVRLFIIPFFVYAMMGMDNVWLSMALFLFSGITDVVDGWIARHYNMITDVGKVYDPFVDKMMQISALVCLAIKTVIPVWVLCVILLKEITMIIVGIVLYAKKIVVHSNWYGKLATVAFYAIVLALIAFPHIDYILKTVLIAILVGVLLFAAFGYLFKITNPAKCDIYDQKIN